jgi:HPt (histidine-containing phosphotransfer) domain-containing protein
MAPGNLDVAALANSAADSRGADAGCPLDLDHLARQTLGDREVEREVLALFVAQARTVRDKMAEAAPQERLFLAHNLKGSARAVGAFAVADCAADIETSPNDPSPVERLLRLVDEVCDFIATNNG